MAALTLRVVATLALVIISTSAVAFELGPVKVRGFLSQGFSLSSGNNFLGESTEGSFDSSMGAINFLWSPDPGVYFSAQLISRNYGESPINEEDLALDYGLIGVDLFTDRNNQIDLRAGLLKIPMGIYGKTRDIPVTYPGVVLPQVLYAEWTRNSFLRSKGIGTEYKHNSLIGSINIEGQLGEVRMPRNQISGDNDPSVTNVPDPNFVALKAMYTTPNNMFFAGRSLLFVDYRSYSSSESGGLRIDSTNDNLITTDISFAGLNINSWSLTAEYMRRKNDIKNTFAMYNSGTNTLVNSFELEHENISKAYYVQLEKMFGSKHSGYIRNDNKYVVKSMGKTASNYTNSYVFGFNWRPTSKILIKAEHHYIDGGSADMVLIDDNPNKADGYDRYWDLYLLQFIYSF